MRARLKCENPDEIEYTVTLTMTAKEWELLRAHLDAAKLAWPASWLTNQINDLLAQARKIYWGPGEQ